MNATASPLAPIKSPTPISFEQEDSLKAEDHYTLLLNFLSKYYPQKLKSLLEGFDKEKLSQLSRERILSLWASKVKKT
jgi:hypothetical protein